MCVCLQNESEILPFPNKEQDFMLPEQEYDKMMNQEFPRSSEAAAANRSTGTVLTGRL